MSTAQARPGGLVTAVACPFRYPNGKACTGHVVRVDLHAAVVVWLPREDGEWVCELSPSSRYRVYCSEKGTHAAVRRQMSFYLSNLPPALKQVILSASVTWPGHRPLAGGPSRPAPPADVGSTRRPVLDPDGASSILSRREEDAAVADAPGDQRGLDQ